ncbi:hypothetical protein LCGC14_1716000 [marine sediment metagenome]|uniref:Uncharacterized protein n=1 Tax=marine sediment metagenome TaxID=412755 RepID=A0A0F9HDK4_9ZZZZ
MAKGCVCERCGRSDIMVSYRCEVCKRSVCALCITVNGDKQICRDCKGVRHEPVPA